MASVLQAAPASRRAEVATTTPAAASSEELSDVQVPVIDPQEMDEWLESVDDFLHRYGPEALGQMLTRLYSRAQGLSVPVVPSMTTPYVNTIPPEAEPEFPGDRDIEKRLRSIIRWNAMAMVVRAYRTGTGVGGHISTFASSATLVETGFNHFFHSRTKDHTGDMIYFQGHSSPGMYSRAFVEGRLTEKNLENFRRELPRGQGLSSYPHPWLMPDFWQFPTVSMGLGPICSLYHARFLRYLQHRNLIDTSKSRVWAFLGDGEVDEPESLGAITLAAREKLDNVTWVINCNLQRLDGPVRGNGKIIQELEGVFRGAGWNVIKVVWGSDWQPLFDADDTGLLVKTLGEVVDGQFQKYSVETGEFIRNDFFGRDPELLKLVEDMTDDQLRNLRRGGHDPIKVYAAYKAATDHKGAPTVVLAHTVKGFGMGEAGEGKNTAHQTKDMGEQALIQFRDRFNLPLTDEQAKAAIFYRPPADSPEMKYLHDHRKKLGGYLPVRVPTTEKLTVPSAAHLIEEAATSSKARSTTTVLSETIKALIRDKNLGTRVVPIIPDEAQTFGMEALFSQFGIYSSKGQLYTPVDAGTAKAYKESQTGQILMEGINEAGAMSSFVAAGTAYANVGLSMIPFYIYYSMFGFQRVGDLIWLAGDSRCKGFLCGGTSGRTTLNGEGLQHEDGHSQLMAGTVPNLIAYDPAFGYELCVIVQDGLRRMFVEGEDVFYYLSIYNENYVMPSMPAGAEEGIIKGIHPLDPSVSASTRAKRPQLLGSGPILQCVIQAQKLLAEKFGVTADVWSVTSYNELKREAQSVARWNRLHPDKKPKTSYIEQVLGGQKAPIISSSDNVQLVAEQIRPYLSCQYVVCGTDGFGRSESREALRRHFEIDAESVAYTTLVALSKDGQFDAKKLPQALKDLGLDPEKIDPAFA
ncbi:pyruvate dehydrogenase (acetyl-transferring), homodimeric type [Schlesneria paludicola]|uniref:pyruvate dehydrogenase (acetyl-transferring), homodimeric type n=1 Tax=Schlesneria paludicola TaxID=360056 RepID=UPI0009FF6F60|nr:pyruvate dehydrogenase (acetyl-transferring), homodimeric type [Schlesneria paludicola]